MFTTWKSQGAKPLWFVAEHSINTSIKTAKMFPLTALNNFLYSLMSVHFGWKVLFCTTEAQPVHNLGALRSAEMLQEVTLRRAHPLFGTHCQALHSSLPAAWLCHPQSRTECALWHWGENGVHLPSPFAWLPSWFCIQFFVYNSW